MPPLSNEEAKKLAVFRYIKGDNGNPRNDGNPLMKGRWIDHCEEYVGNTEHSLLTLVSQGVILTREGTICSSFEHASDIVHGYHQRKSWSDPAPLMYVRTPEIRAHRLAVSAGVPLPDFDHKTLPSRYIISPPHLIETSSRLCNLIIATCTIETSRNTMRKKCDRDGLELIKLEYASVRRYLDKKACEAIALAMDGFIRLGLVELSQSCFAELRGDFEGWNKVQETDRKMSDALICGKYVQLMERHLSDAEYLRFEGLLDKRSAHGDLELVSECIDVTLARFTSQSMVDSYLSGKAFNARKGDTIKPGGDGGDHKTVDQRIANGESPPGPCPFPGCHGNHWLKHCEKRIAKEAKAKAKKTANAAKKAKAKSKDDDASDDVESQPGHARFAVFCDPDDGIEPTALDTSQLFSGAAGEQRSVSFGAASDGAHGSARLVTTHASRAQDGLRIDSSNPAPIADEAVTDPDLHLVETLLGNCDAAFVARVSSFRTDRVALSEALSSLSSVHLAKSDPSGLSKCVSVISSLLPKSESLADVLGGFFGSKDSSRGTAFSGVEEDPPLSKAMRLFLPSNGHTFSPQIDIMIPQQFSLACSCLREIITHLEQVETDTLIDPATTLLHSRDAPAGITLVQLVSSAVCQGLAMGSSPSSISSSIRTSSYHAISALSAPSDGDADEAEWISDRESQSGDGSDDGEDQPDELSDRDATSSPPSATSSPPSATSSPQIAVANAQAAGDVRVRWERIARLEIARAIRLGVPQEDARSFAAVYSELADVAADSSALADLQSKLRSDVAEFQALTQATIREVPPRSRRASRTRPEPSDSERSRRSRDDDSSDSSDSRLRLDSTDRPRRRPTASAPRGTEAGHVLGPIAAALGLVICVALACGAPIAHHILPTWITDSFAVATTAAVAACLSTFLFDSFSVSLTLTLRVAQAFSSLSVSTRDPHGHFAGPAGTSRSFCPHFNRYRMSMADIETRILRSLLLSPSTLLVAGFWLPYLLFHWLVNAYFRVGCLALQVEEPFTSASLFSRSHSVPIDTSTARPFTEAMDAASASASDVACQLGTMFRGHVAPISSRWSNLAAASTRHICCWSVCLWASADLACIALSSANVAALTASWTIARATLRHVTFLGLKRVSRGAARAVHLCAEHCDFRCFRFDSPFAAFSEVSCLRLASARCACALAGILAILMQPPRVCSQLPERSRHVDLFTDTPKRKGRALISRQTQKRKSKRSRGLSVFAAALSLCMDSGCTWHVHHDVADLINVRPCNDTVEGIDRKIHRCSCQGDMPIAAQDAGGVWRQLLIRNVRCVPSIPDSLVSIDQLWDDSKTDVVFRDVRSVLLAGEDTPSRKFPFAREGGLSLWHVVGNARDPARPFDHSRHAQALTVHSARSTSHVASLSTAAAVDLFHHRLHAGAERLRQLPRMTADAPECLVHARHVTCDGCTAANATRLPHSGSRYSPSYPGRLIHADIAGPFIPSSHGHYRYILVLVDDHSRFKAVYFLRNKSEQAQHARAFIAKMNALLNAGKAKPSHIVGSLLTDNAGEFLSHEFARFLDSESIDHTTCPPYVHELNGVAERAIRSIMDNARAFLEASNAPKSFWHHAVGHAVDCLNRTTGPPDSEMSSYQCLTSQVPKIMGLFPFGCRMYAVKPRAQYSKTALDARAWSGIHIGRDPTIPGSLLVWVPSEGKVVSTSDVYVDETLMPWLPEGRQRVHVPIPHAAHTSADQPPGVPSPPEPDSEPVLPVSPDLPSELSLDAIFHRVTHRAAPRGMRSRTVLVLFSGSYSRPDGLAAFLARYGLSCVMVDSDTANGGDEADDILRDSFYESLLQRCHAGEFFAVFAAPPCSTFSVARFFPKDDGSPGAPPVRDREHIRGFPVPPPAHAKELAIANRTVQRTVAVLLSALGSGAEFCLENPIDRGDDSTPHFIDARHGPIWLMPEMLALSSVASTESVSFPLCAFGAPVQKLTTLMATPRLAALLRPLGSLRCTHVTHASNVGGSQVDGNWTSAAHAAYPADLNLYLARVLASLVLPVGELNPDRPVRVGSATAEDAGNEGADDAQDPPARPPPLPDGLPDRSPEPLDAAVPPPIAAAEPAPAASPHSTRQRYPSRLGGERGVTGTPVMTRSRARAAGAALLIQRGPLSGASIKSGTGCMRKVSSVSADPRNRKEALADDSAGWTGAEQREIQNHTDAGSWKYIPRDKVPPGRRLVRFTWVYKKKRDGSMKARLCVQGCSQIPGVDFHQTFCGTLRSTSLRLLASVAARCNMRMHRYDFVAAFLQGSLEPGEVVYCYPPPGYEANHVDETGRPMVCEVQKPIYGMAQAGRRWQRSLYPWLLEFGFCQAHGDANVFHMKRGDERLILGCYVDDLFTLHSHEGEGTLYAEFVAALFDRWKVEDEGEVSDLLNVEIDRTGDSVYLRQTNYIDNLVQQYAPDGVPDSFKSTDVPADESLPLLVQQALESEATPAPSDVHRFQAIVGSLNYCATHTRPDIALAVGLLCRALTRPTPALYSAAQRVVWYLHRHRHVGLRYESSSAARLSGYSDSDWATRHSTSGFVFQYCRAAVSWATKKQATIALSSCEAEIVAASEASKEAVYLRTFLSELGLGQPGPVSLAVDNQSAINVAYNPEHHSRVKHIERRHFFVREKVENHELCVPFVRSADNMADFFTKPLASKAFFRLRDAIMNVPA